MRWAIVDLRRQALLSCILVFIFGLSGYLNGRSYFALRDLQKNWLGIPWDVDLLITPKGLTLDQLEEDIIRGNASELIPSNLYVTLSDPKAPGDLLPPSARSLRFAGILPLARQDQKARWLAVGATDLLPKFPFEIQTTESLDTQIEKSTPEWKNHVLEAILVRGDPESILSLKNLVNRKTVAQAVSLSSEQNRLAEKKENAEKQLFQLFVFFNLSFLSTLILALQIYIQNARTTFQVFQELGFSKAFQNQYRWIQFGILAGLPFAVGLVSSLL